MGLFDNLIKQIDNGLKAVENGALEERLDQFAETLEKRTGQVENTLNNVAERPDGLLKVAEQKKDQLETKAKHMSGQVGKGIDTLRGKK